MTNNSQGHGCAILTMKEKQITQKVILNLTEGTIADEYPLSTIYANHLCVKYCLISVAW